MKPMRNFIVSSQALPLSLEKQTTGIFPVETSNQSLTTVQSATKFNTMANQSLTTVQSATKFNSMSNQRYNKCNCAKAYEQHWKAGFCNSVSDLFRRNLKLGAADSWALMPCKDNFSESTI